MGRVATLASRVLPAPPPRCRRAARTAVVVRRAFRATLGRRRSTCPSRPGAHAFRQRQELPPRTPPRPLLTPRSPATGSPASTLRGGDVTTPDACGALRVTRRASPSAHMSGVRRARAAAGAAFDTTTASVGAALSARRLSPTLKLGQQRRRVQGAGRGGDGTTTESVERARTESRCAALSRRARACLSTFYEKASEQREPRHQQVVRDAGDRRRPAPSTT